ncbi:DNA-binding FadR family transcriptional regulator [Alkalibacillus flavidus]|uniref:DNA-binding FadR family transcriptional regulator n=1 Tax=Alkalibacillus flavidus TaxID=546021 RepID=A0ABV2KVM3_9BACI
MSNQSKMKVYQEVLNEIRRYIEDRQLQDGDRIPSERELSEQLNASRSSIREALRAIELLGLIETRHGEGTFLRTYKPYQSVELLSTFVLTEANTKDELTDVQFMLEQLCLRELSQKESLELTSIEQMVSDHEAVHTTIFIQLFNLLGNQLLLKIWHLVVSFNQTIDQQRSNQLTIQPFLKAFINRQFDKALNYHMMMYDSTE